MASSPIELPPATPELALGDLLLAAIKMSPTGDVQRAFSATYTKMLIDNVSSKSAALQMLSAMQDGLRCGNWPVG